MTEFALACERIAATSSKLAKTAELAAYFTALDDADLAAATRFFSGNPLPAGDPRSASLGGATIIRAATALWGIERAAFSKAYRETGDLGAALGRFVQPPRALELGLFTETLRPATLASLLDEAANASGKSAQRRRQLVCERILRACTTELEARYAVKVLTGDLRIGLREGLVLDALAQAFGRSAHDIRRAEAVAGDVGRVALAARHGTLDSVTVQFGSPVGFMLATPVPYGSSYRELASGEWQVEDKFDGIRAQVHKYGGTVRIFSRTFADAGTPFPEVVEALAALPGDFVLDGEIVARDESGVLPFRTLQPRLQRKAVDDDLRRRIPVAYVAFDALAAGERFLLDEPLAVRRDVLASIVQTQRSVVLAEAEVLGALGEDAVNERFAAARARGNEGLVFKRRDSAYAAGRRGKAWLKLKRELSTLDCVVVAVEWGHGKRSGVLSDYTFAVRTSTEDARLLTIGKAFTGLTDAEIATLTQWFLAHQRGPHNRHAIAVDPEIVIEVAFDVIQRSTLHDSGFSLRFPRIARLRPDKPVTEIDTLAGVERIYSAMLEREGLSGER